MKLVPLPVFRPANAERLGLHRSFFQTGTERRMAWRSLNLEGELMESELPQTIQEKTEEQFGQNHIFFGSRAVRMHRRNFASRIQIWLGYAATVCLGSTSAKLRLTLSQKFFSLLL
ncbi:hypothetical protein BDFG_03919 [Blastomyces dermatitidis ATCC 26199]|nr:hypothetical protein BDFG_03919 [Blastomyces dermatitidis ATCC 26199]